MKTPHPSKIQVRSNLKTPASEIVHLPATIPETVVMKFGGTSVADANTLAMMDRALSQESARACVVILSALAGTTDGIVALFNALQSGKSAAVHEAMAHIEQIYIRFLEGWNLPELGMCFQARWQIFEGQVQRHLAQFPKTLTAADRDGLLVFGELMTTELYALLFKRRNKDVCLIRASDWMVTDRQFGQAQPLAHESQAKIQKHLCPLLKPGRVIITQGFAGVTNAGEMTTIGRGGSDFSATFLAAQLKAQRVIIWTDTEGLLSADPRYVPGAQTLPTLTYDQAESLACNGAKVLHFRAIQPLKSAGVPLEIRSTFEPEGQASLISPSAFPGEAIFSLGLKPVHAATGGEEDVFPCRHLSDIPLRKIRQEQTRIDRQSRFEQRDNAPTYRQWASQLQPASASGEEPDFANICLFFPGLKHYPKLCKQVVGMLQNKNVPTYYSTVANNQEFALLVVSYHHGNKAIAQLHQYLTEFTALHELAAKAAPALVAAH